MLNIEWQTSRSESSIKGRLEGLVRSKFVMEPKVIFLSVRRFVESSSNEIDTQSIRDSQRICVLLTVDGRRQKRRSHNVTLS